VAVEEHRIQQNNNVIWDFLDALEQAPETYKNSHNYMIDRIQAYQTIKNWQKAESFFSELAETNIDEYELYSVRASLYLEKGAYTQALDNILNALKLKPSLHITRNTAVIYLLSGDYTKATKYLDQVTQVAPNDFWALKTYADLSLVSGEANKAVESYLKLLESTPNDAAILSNLAIAYSLMGKFELSNENAIKAYQLSSTNLSIILNLADSYSYLGQEKQARKIYEKLIELTKGTTNLDEFLIRIQALSHTGKSVEALKKISKLESENADSYDLLFTKAMVLTKLGETQSAMLAIEISIEEGWSEAFFALPWFKSLCKQSKQLSEIIGAKSINTLCTYDVNN